MAELSNKPSRAWVKLTAPYQNPDVRRSLAQLADSFVPYVLLWAAMAWTFKVGLWPLTLVLAVPAAGMLVPFALGLAISLAPVDTPWLSELRVIQNDLFDLGADLATPMKPDERDALRVIPAQTQRIERLIDEHNEHLGSLTSFILPGGSPFAAALHMARTVTRRAERFAVGLLFDHPGEVNPEAIKYLNRLSDLLFVLTRIANDNGGNDVLWVPGASRESE